MKLLPHTLSWSALLRGWPDHWLSTPELQAFAQERLLLATGEELMLVSELISGHPQTPRADLQATLQRLADREDWPEFFALREWQVVRLKWTLAQLDSITGEEDLEVYNQLRALHDVWEHTGTPLDLPLLEPFLASDDEMADEHGGLNLTRRQLDEWAAAQEKLLETARQLRDAGHLPALHTQAQALADVQRGAQQRLDLLQMERGLLRRPQDWQARVAQFNAEQLRRRVQEALRLPSRP
ncbi:hypothetical protein [Deinococcus arcticus]|uniref:Uncharacterized protein n=1 Tax=Deinococcus arcticus TaxID=2136176 RepID=A0A2T3WAX4_9DEIO|nr:hypothetical protein [Deinococcus arcticus]PTA68954.1 hypothetical protein C8263_03895 [Deinococcus arcticus]